MAGLNFYFDNKKVNEDIANWRDLEITVTFDDDTGQGTIESGSLEFVGDLAQKVNDWNSRGMTGGPGILEAPPFRIEACGNTVVFDGGVNTAECTTTYECDKVIAPLRSNRIDFINDRATSFTFPYLASSNYSGAGKIFSSDYYSVPYVVNSIPDYVNIMVAGISLYAMIKESRELIEKTKALIEELTGDSVMTVTSSVPTVNVGLGMAIGRVLIDVIRITFYLLYLAFIIKTIISLIQMLKENLIQPIKYKKGIKVITLFQRASAYLGYNFSSSILSSAAHKDDLIIPKKIARFSNKTITQQLFGQSLTHKDYDDNSNSSSTGVPEWTFADLILREEQRLNAEIRIIGKTIYLEVKNSFKIISKYVLPDIQGKNADPHGTNACELASNYKISYAIDAQDSNTSDIYDGTSCQMQLAPKVVLNKMNVLFKNITEIDLQYSLAKIKTDLSPVENVVSAVYTVAADIYNGVTGFFNEIVKVINKVLKAIASITGGKPPQIPLIPAFPPNPVLKRIGVMLLSSDFIGIEKIVNIDSNGKPSVNNQYLTAASTLMDELHYTNFAVRTITASGARKNDHNQWYTYTNKEVPFCCEDFLNLLPSNYCKTVDQKEARIKIIKWKPSKNIATIDFRVKQQYTNNFIQTYSVDGQ